jgi:hypothetical protein
MPRKRILLSQSWLLRGGVVLLIGALIAPSAVSAWTYDGANENLRRGTVEEPANGTTVVAVQGFKFKGAQNGKKPARVVGVGPAGDVRWVHDGAHLDVTWFYDVAPVNGSNLLVSGTAKGKTVVYEVNPRTDEIVWTERFPDVHDTHDADLLGGGTELVIANMRNYNATSGVNEDRIFVYNRTTDEVTWEWVFARQTDWRETQGGKYAGDASNDWTHLNDVDVIGDGRFLVSPRNFDQVLVVDRSTKAIEMRLGRDGDHDVLYEQHNPTYLESRNGTPTILVADSENDRVVEYAKRGHGWTRTWELGSSQDFNWPRDADRLPDGNTLVVDTNNQRVVEVTPGGEIVWEFYAPWAPYDVERMHLGDEPAGPTIADQDAEGEYSVVGSAGLTPGTGDRLTFAQWLSTAFAETPFDEPVERFANRWSKVAPWVRPVWMEPWDFVAATLSVLLSCGWVAAEAVCYRRRTQGK